MKPLRFGPKLVVGLLGYYLIAQFLPMSKWALIGKMTAWMRAYFARMLLARCGKGVVLERRAVFGSGRNLELGDNVVLGANFWMCGPVRIGNDTLIGPSVRIYRNNHVFSDPDVPIRCQGLTAPTQLEIEDDAWIGYGVVILPSCRKIGKGSVIAACSVLAKDVPSYSVFGGNPAKFLKSRGPKS